MCGMGRMKRTRPMFLKSTKEACTEMAPLQHFCNMDLQPHLVCARVGGVKGLRIITIRPMIQDDDGGVGTWTLRAVGDVFILGPYTLRSIYTTSVAGQVLFSIQRRNNRARQHFSEQFLALVENPNPVVRASLLGPRKKWISSRN